MVETAETITTNTVGGRGIARYLLVTTETDRVVASVPREVPDAIRITEEIADALLVDTYTVSAPVHLTDYESVSEASELEAT